MSNEPGGKSMAAFLVKKGDYLCSLAETHSQAAEHKKAKNLYLQAAGWYKKAGINEKMNFALQKAKEEDSKIEK
ncbi:MAG: hypothetical protein ACTSWN_02315 [Promethearchaeota archaeon]